MTESPSVLSGISTATRRRICFSPAVATVLAIVGTARADSYRSYANHRLVEPTGHFYLVVKVLPGGPEDPGKGVPVEIAIAEHKPDSPPVISAEGEDPQTGMLIENPDVVVRDGDTLHAQVRLKRVPRLLFVSSTGLGFVGLDVFGYNYGWPGRRKGRTDDAVVIVAKDGMVRHRKDMSDLFSDDELLQFHQTGGGVRWLGGGWIDESRHELIVVGGEMRDENGETPKERLFRVVSLDSGMVLPGSSDLVIAALKVVNWGALQQALDLTVKLELTEALPHLPDILSSAELPISARLRAAVALATFGDRQGATLVAEMATSSGDRYAVEHLPLLLGDNAVTLIRDVVRRFPDQDTRAACPAMSSLGVAAVPTPVELLTDHHYPKGQYFAAECVSNIGQPARDAIPALIEILRVPPKDERKYGLEWITVHAVASIGPEAKDAVPLVERLVERAKALVDEIKTKSPDADKFESGLFSAERDYDDWLRSLKSIRG
jgi:hypothetical protein